MATLIIFVMTQCRWTAINLIVWQSSSKDPKKVLTHTDTQDGGGVIIESLPLCDAESLNWSLLLCDGVHGPSVYSIGVFLTTASIPSFIYSFLVSVSKFRSHGTLSIDSHLVKLCHVCLSGCLFVCFFFLSATSECLSAFNVFSLQCLYSWAET